MEKTSNEKKQLQAKIEHTLNLWEKENEIRKNLHIEMQQFINKYGKQAIEEQKTYKENVDRIINIKKIEQCEEFINKIAKDITVDIVMNNMHPIMQNLIEDSKEKTKKANELNLKDVEALKVLSKEQRDKAFKFEKEEKQLREELDSDFDTVTNTIYPLMMFSRDQWSFLWNLATWKINLLLTKQMRDYTYLVAILTGFVVLFTMLLIFISFIK